MARTNKTRSALFTSIISLLLCVSMLVGTTFAWFTDTASTGVNTITSGNLDLVLEWHNGDGEWEEVTADTLLFKQGALYEPGYTEVAYLRVRNAGTLALKYILTVDVANEEPGINVYDDPFKLSDHIKFGVVTADVNEDVTIYKTREEAQAAVANDAKGLATFSTDGYVTLEHGDSIQMALVVYMPTTVGNIANYKTGTTPPSITLGVNVFATQKDSDFEKDSYGKDYDEIAPNLITVGGVAYKTLNDAIEAAEAGSVIEVTGSVTYTFPEGANKDYDAKNVTIKGDGNTVLTFAGNGTNNTLTNVTLENLTVVDMTTSNNESAWEFGYLELANVTAKNVIFKNGIMIDGIAAEEGIATMSLDVECDNTFIDCIFTGKTENGLAMYGVWVASGSAYFENCTFEGTRGLKVHEDYGTEVSAVYVYDCDFVFTAAQKPGVALGTLNADTTISITESIFTNVGAGDQTKYIYETDTDVNTFAFTEENNIISVEVAPGLHFDGDETYYIVSKEGLYSFADWVNNQGNTFYGKTVILDDDIDLEGEAWTPIGSESGTALFSFDGRGHTISNLYVNAGDAEAGLFGWFGGYNGTTATPALYIKNLTIANANINGSKRAGALAGYVETTNDVTIEGITVKDSVINGSRAGGISGIQNGTTVTKCVVENTTVQGEKSVGEIVGYVHYADKITDCDTSNKVTLIVAGQEALEYALDKADTTETITLADGTYVLYEKYGAMKNKTITIQGGKNAVIDNSAQVGVNMVQDLTNTTITFDGVTVKWSDANEGYQGLKNPAKVVYKDCDIYGTQFMYCGADFIGCTFYTENSYAVYTRSGGDYTFTDCTFYTGGRAIMMYHDYAITATVTATNCKFYDDGTYSSKDKAAIETGNGGGASTYTIVINNCTTEGFETNNSSSALWGNKDNMDAEHLIVTIDGAWIISTQDALDAALKAAVTGKETIINLADGSYHLNNVGMQGKTITFKGSEGTILDMTGWQYGYAAATGANLTFENLTMNWVATENYQGFAPIAKLTYKNCAINGLQYLYGETVFENCTLSNEQCWAVWTYGATKVDFTGCTFETGGHAVLVYNEYSDFTNSINFTDCVFKNSGLVNEQWGHEDLVETSMVNPTTCTSHYYLTFTGCTVTGSDKQNLWGNKNDLSSEQLTVTVDSAKVH